MRPSTGAQTTETSAVIAKTRVATCGSSPRCWKTATWWKKSPVMSRERRESPSATIQNVEVRSACFNVRPVISGWSVSRARGGFGSANVCSRRAGVGRGVCPIGVRPGYLRSRSRLRPPVRFGRGSSVRPEADVLRPVANEPQCGKKQRPGADPEPEPGLAPADRLDEPLGERRMQRHARGKPEPDETKCKATLPLEPLRDDVACAKEEAPLPEIADRREAESEDHESVDEAERDGGRAEQGRDHRKHAACPPPIDLPARERQPEGGGEGRDSVRERDLGIAEAEVFGDNRQEDAERMRLPGAAREEDEGAGGDHQPAEEKPPVDAVNERVGGAGHAVIGQAEAFAIGEPVGKPRSARRSRASAARRAASAGDRPRPAPPAGERRPVRSVMREAYPGFAPSRTRSGAGEAQRDSPDRSGTSASRSRRTCCAARRARTGSSSPGSPA